MMITTGSRGLGAAILVATVACGKPGHGTAERGETARPAAPVAAGDATALIDREVEAMWKKAGVTPAPDASDSEFIRRVTLDIAGRTPSLEEAARFLHDRKPDKRTRLVDRLLASEDYAAHWGTLYADALVGRVVRQRGRFPQTPGAWFEKAFKDGMALDEMARQLITATGPLTENGAVGYYAGNRARGGTMETLAGNTARFFLGLQIQCAQCHDHPTDKRWKKADFASFAAFFGEVNLRRSNKKDPASSYTEDVAFGWEGKPEAKVPLRRVTPRFLGHDVAPAGGENRRAVLARALTGSPLFARAAVGRTWTRLFGRGLAEPWDDLGSEEDPRQPPLLKELAAGLVKSGYDHRWLLRAIVLSRAYNRSSSGGAAPAGAQPGALEAVFARAAVRPLTADQLFRSLLLATGIELAEGDRLPQWKIEERKEKALRQYLFAFEDDEGEESDAFTGSVPQALLLRNGDLTNAGARAFPGMVLGRVLVGSKDAAQRLEWMFLGTYARPPSPEEKAEYLEFLSSGRETAFEDLFHALITSTEFVTNH